MAICYLCGREMITQQEYNKDPLSYSEKPAINHAEHIIQNSLYGRLTSSDILCLSCGAKLSEEVDTAFNKLFAGFTEPIKHILAQKDHGDKPKTLRGYIFKEDGSKIEVQVRDNKVLPLKPEYKFFVDRNEVEIYAPKAVAKSYDKQVLKELAGKGVDINDVKIKVVDDISHLGTVGVNFSEGVEDFNVKFKLGLNKIATGFASLQGIDRKEMPCTIDIENSKLIFSSNVTPFYPIGIMDMLIEAFRIAQEDEFPTHTLILFTDDSFGETKLVCYIDLFSTFQHYVILNHDYKGEPINRNYYQTIIKQEKPQLVVRKFRMKHLSIVANALGVKPIEMAGMGVEEMYVYLEKKYNQYTVKYSLDLNSYLSHIGPKAATNYILKKKGFTSHLSNLEEEIIKGIPELAEQDLITIHHELERLENQNPSSFYRQNFISTDESNNSSVESTLAHMIVLNNAKFEGFKTYGFIKFYTLMHFIAKNEEPQQV